MEMIRSLDEIIGYTLQAKDGEVGRVIDFLFDDERFVVRYLVVDTRSWLPGGKILLSPAWLETISWQEKKACTDLLAEVIRQCPVYDPAKPVTREYEIILFDYYGRAHYWDESN